MASLIFFLAAIVDLKLVSHDPVTVGDSFFDVFFVEFLPVPDEEAAVDSFFDVFFEIEVLVCKDQCVDVLLDCRDDEEVCRGAIQQCRIDCASGSPP